MTALHQCVTGARSKFLSLLDNPHAAQRRQLLQILQSNVSSGIGRKYSFASIRDELEYRAVVPLHRYDDLHESMERAADGEPCVLTEAPPIAFERTGGSTGGAKWIPLTSPGLASIQRAVCVWLDDLLTERPRIAQGRMYWPVSPIERPSAATRGGIPIGMPSDAAYLGDELQSAIAPLLIPPGEDLRSVSDLTFISVWSPTFLLELWRDLDASPESLWPRLDTISCWTSASSAQFAMELQRLVPSVYIQGKGLLATEGVVTIPLERYAQPILAIESNFYEFLDAGGACKCAWELEQNGEYDVLLTTHAGLYRYMLGDRVRVAGFAGRTPLLEFLGRAGIFSDLVGEKLSDPFVTACLEGLSGFAMIAPAVAPHPHYLLFVDRRQYTLSDAATLTDRVEDRLCRNPQYAYARQLSQLSPLQAVLLDRPLERYLAHCVSTGQRPGDIKPASLSNNPDWHAIFSGGSS